MGSKLCKMQRQTRLRVKPNYDSYVSGDHAVLCVAWKWTALEHIVLTQSFLRFHFAVNVPSSSNK